MQSIVRKPHISHTFIPLLHPHNHRIKIRSNPWICSATTERRNESTVRLLCPICLTTELPPYPSQESSKQDFICRRCSRAFDVNAQYIDLTLESGAKSRGYTMDSSLGKSTFQNPFVGFVYERGWRQSFTTSGFPGPDQEFDDALKFFAPVVGEAIMDLSCGSGLFTRRFLSCGLFKEVVAVDFSEAMLTQTQQFISRMKSPPRAKLYVIRADVARLPFPTGSFKAIYSGAAIHCWPNPSQSLAEISRLLAPGGVFVFTTFITKSRELDNLLKRNILLRPLAQSRRPSRVATINVFDEQELFDMTKLVGLERFEAKSDRQYIMIRVSKPHA